MPRIDSFIVISSPYSLFSPPAAPGDWPYLSDAGNPIFVSGVHRKTGKTGGARAIQHALATAGRSRGRARSAAPRRVSRNDSEVDVAAIRVERLRPRKQRDEARAGRAVVLGTVQQLEAVEPERRRTRRFCGVAAPFRRRRRRRRHPHLLVSSVRDRIRRNPDQTAVTREDAKGRRNQLKARRRVLIGELPVLPGDESLECWILLPKGRRR